MKETPKRIFMMGAFLALSLSQPLLAVGEGVISKENLPKLKTGTVPQWENLKDVDIVPCPKQITVEEGSLPVDENLAIVISQASSLRTKTAAADLQQILLEKTAVTVPILAEGLKNDAKNLIVVGTVAELPQLQKDCATARISMEKVEAQGYVIFPLMQDGKQKIILAGKDEQGAYWAAMTLTYLVKNKSIRLARIVDWPDFKNRVCETVWLPLYHLARAQDEQQEKAAWKAVEDGVREAARLKFNYIRGLEEKYFCPDVCFPTDVRAQRVGRAGAYANQRGIKLFLNVSTVVGVEGEEKEFPQMKECLRFLQYYATWSDDQLIDRACEKITRMVELMGPQHFMFHSPDVPGMGWSKRSVGDLKRWGNDRVSAEAYLVGKFFNAMKKGNLGAEFSYVSNPYSMGWVEDSPRYRQQLKTYEELSQKLPSEISFIWREGSMKSAQQLRQLTKKQPQSYYIENSSFHGNRLVGGTARTAKSFYFENGDRDFFWDNCNTTTHPVHKPQNGILAEYSWNTQAPGSVFLCQKNDGKPGWLVDGMTHAQWWTVHDLDGPVREQLIPRVCRLFFGEKVGDTLALAYSVGSSFHENALGGPSLLSDEERSKNSLEFSGRLAGAGAKMAGLWGKPELFQRGTYGLYQSAFKYVEVQKHLEKINVFLMRISAIAESGKDVDRLAGLVGEALDDIKKARGELAADYERYHFEDVPFAAIYGAELSNLKSVDKKLNDLEAAIRFKDKQVKMFGAGNVGKGKKQTILGIAPLPGTFQLDGKLDEWDMASANVLDSSFYNRKLRRQGLEGSKDVIAYWTSAWDKSYLSLAIMVFDDHLSFRNTTSLYNSDAIELWINNDQWVFSFNPEGKPCVESYGVESWGGAAEPSKAFDKSKIGFAARVGDKPHPLHPEMKCWTAEIKIPIEFLKTAPEVGGSFYMALGIDDVDPGEKPSQLFFPETYQHPGMVSGAVLTKDFAKAILQSKAELTVDLLSSEIKNIAKSDATYTCVDLNLALNCKGKVSGISSEIRLYAKDGIHRYKVDVPDILDGQWRNTSPLQINTGNVYESDAGMDLIVQAPAFYRKFVIREGRYRNSSPGYVLNDEDNDKTGKNQAAEKSDDASKGELLYAGSFERGSFDLVDGSGRMIAPTADDGGVLVDFKKGKAVEIKGQGALVYVLNCPPSDKGLIEFWIKPHYGDDDQNRRTFVRFCSENGKNEFRFLKNLCYSYMFLFHSHDKIESVYVKTNRIKLDSWNHIGMQWDIVKRTVQLTINGVTTSRENVEIDFSQAITSLVIGNVQKDGDEPCESSIGGLKVWKM